MLLKEGLVVTDYQMGEKMAFFLIDVEFLNVQVQPNYPMIFLSVDSTDQRCVCVIQLHTGHTHRTVA